MERDNKGQWVKGHYQGFGFKKGSKVWNKDKKGIHLSPKTEFKKGGVAPNKGKKIPSISGKNHYRWKGGITPLIFQIRHCFEYRQWRSDIFTRDSYACIWCGTRGDINADHYPKSFAEILHEYKIISLEQALLCEEFWNINNGRTLCKPCHQKTDTYLHQWKTKS